MTRLCIELHKLCAELYNVIHLFDIIEYLCTILKEVHSHVFTMTTLKLIGK